MLMPFREILYRDLWDLTRVAIVGRNALPIDCLWQMVPFQPCSGHA